MIIRADTNLGKKQKVVPNKTFILILDAVRKKLHP